MYSIACMRTVMGTSQVYTQVHEGTDDIKAGLHLRKLLASDLPVGLRPPDLARVALHLEVLVALAAAEPEDLRQAGAEQSSFLTGAQIYMSQWRGAGE